MALELVQWKTSNKKNIPIKLLEIHENQNEVVIGRHPDNAICIRSLAISRRHAVIKKTEQGFTLYDQKAVNQLFVNGKRLEPGTACELSNQDEIQLGLKPTDDPATKSSEYFVYRFTHHVPVSGQGCKRKLSSPDSISERPSKVSFSHHQASDELARKADEEAIKAKEEAELKLATEAKAATELRIAAEARAKVEAELRAEAEVKAKQEAELRAAAEAKAKEEAEKKALEENRAREEAEAKAEAEKAALEEELAELRRLQEEQREAMAAKEEVLRLEMQQLQTKHQAEVEAALKAKEEQMQTSIKTFQDEQCKKSEEISKQLEEKEKQLSEAKEHEAKMAALEEELKATRTEQERLSKISTDLAVQEKITDLLEDQLLCTICSEFMIKPKNFPCSHAFCGYCIDKWLEKKKECPVCRSRVNVATQNYLLTSLIDKAVEQMSAENQDARKSLIAARDAELAEKNKPKSKKGKKKQTANRRQQQNPSGTAANNPSSSRISTATATRANTVNRPTTSTTAPSTSATVTEVTTSQSSGIVPMAANEGIIGEDNNETIVLSSDSEFENQALGDDDEDSDSESDSEALGSSDSEEFDEDNEDWWDNPYFSRGWGGYGRCYSCGQTGHWRPQCPYR